MNKNTLLDKICPCLTGNPRAEILDHSSESSDWRSNMAYLLGNLIKKYENKPDALVCIKNDLQSMVFELNSVIINAR